MQEIKHLEAIENLIASDSLQDQFEYGSEEQRYEILDFLERLMDVSEKADALATKLIFKESYLEKTKAQNDQK